ncbi:MAG: hypothetical protein MOB07_04615 [Acidobacteria bacterium]|nr:hypothetical protein [Acidobacteriota bacterium]
MYNLFGSSPNFFILLSIVLTLSIAVPVKSQPAYSTNCASKLAYPSPVMNREEAQQPNALRQTQSLVDELISASYPELRDMEIQIRLFEGKSDFFRTRFDIPQFLFGGKMRYIISVNPRVFEWQAPEAGVRAIVAHELAHILYFEQQNRMRHFSLVRLALTKFTARFERRTDLEAISRGYGIGLKEYRHWLYQHIPQKKLLEKRRNYFSPDEIDAILSISRQRPELLDYWRKHTPRNIQDISQPQSSTFAK